MKNISKHIQASLLVMMIVGLVSCKKDFLEITPKGNLIAEKTSDYNLLLNNLDLLNLTSVGVDALAQVPMGDEVAAIETYFTGAALRTQRLFRWDDVIYEPEQDANEMTMTMRNLYTYNKVINEVMNSSDGTEQQKKSLQAEAMAGRAWTNFLLINYYGKPYSSTSVTDPGFPIVKNADVTETKFARATVQEVYDFIISDLRTAIPNLSSQVTHRLRMSKASAEAILGKVYLFQGKYTEALQQLNAAITDLNGASVPVALYDYNAAFGTGGSFLPIGTFGPTYPTAPNNQESVYAKQFSNSWIFTNNEIVVTAQMLPL